MALAVEACIVALLGRDDGARQQLRQALQDLGAAVAFEAEPKGADAAALLQHRPNVVIVNLADDMDDDIDHLQAVFDAPGVNVVFNDADVSGHLAGWDLARWARHLAAKVLGHDDTMPPPPPGAERPGVAPVASFASVVAPEPIHAAASVESGHEDILGAEPADSDIDLSSALGLVESSTAESAARPLATNETVDPVSATEPAADFFLDPASELAPQGVSLDVDVSSIEMAMALADGPAPERLSSTPEPVASDSFAAEELAEHEVDFDFSFETDPIAPVHEGDAGESDSAITAAEELAPVEGEDPASGFDWDLDEATAEPLVREAAQADEGELSIPAVSWSLDDAADAQADDTELLDDQVAALAAQLDAFEVGGSDRPQVEDLQFPSTPEVSATHSDVVEPETTTATKPVASSSFGELSLNLSDDDALGSVSPKSGSNFDFSKVADLGLEPIDEAAADAVDPLLVAMGLAEAPSLEEFYQASEPKGTASSGIAHVVVLGASIGGPDALRSFLAELPVNFPAVFLIVQHLESGYFERLSQQLQKATSVPVKLATANMVASSGEVLVVPANEHFSLEPAGRVVFRPHDAPPHYTPSIDAVLRDVADRFGKRATAIIFSGMAGDAVEGAVYLTSKGGEVWAQDPQSCVVSSMVDGARARGVVEFTGSPRELAARCIAQFGS
ncbi:MAG TPA: chemotaxis protein CheB [Chiayiivirga sp.]|nr:chemotaxis protein CheB [Chiayiivirga sp.]